MGEEDVLTPILPIVAPEVRIRVRDLRVVQYMYEGIALNGERIYSHITDQSQIITNSTIGALVEISIPTREKLVRSHLNVGEKNYEAV